MPMIDVHFPADLIPEGRRADLARGLAIAVLEAEGAPISPPYTTNTAAFLHELPADGVHTGEGPAQAVRIDVTTPPGALSREGQRELVAAATRLTVEAAGDEALTGRVWVVLSEAAEGGWGVAGQALGQAEFQALAAAASAA